MEEENQEENKPSTSGKRTHDDENTASADDINSIILYFPPQRFQSKRLQIIKACATQNGYKVFDDYREGVTHVVTEFETIEQVQQSLPLIDTDVIQVVKTQWFNESITAGHPLPVTSQYSLLGLGVDTDRANKKVKQDDTPKCNIEDYNVYACQRRTTLNHKNVVLVQALQILEKHAIYRDDQSEKDSMRALAFAKAISALKSLPFDVRKIQEVAKLKDLGSHSKKVIQEILEDGICAEVESIKEDEWFQTMEIFMNIFGVGPVTAKKWYKARLRTLCDVTASEFILTSKDSRLLHGLAFYEDLNTTLMKKDADRILDFIQSELNEISPGSYVQVTGGFRRGKTTGHDVDVLITHPKEGKESGVLVKLIDSLVSKCLLPYGRALASTFEEDVLRTDPKSASSLSTMDNFEKWIGIFKYPVVPKHPFNFKGEDCQNYNEKMDYKTLEAIAKGKRKWRAVRLDLIIAPQSQFYYALVGWTGNKHFNRSLREYSRRELNMKLTSHGLWDFNKQISLPASSEKEVFDNLKLEYFEPCDRNA